MTGGGGRSAGRQDGRRAGRLALRALAIGVGLLLSLAGCAPGVEVYAATGTVQSVDPAARQLIVAHDEIPGLMPAMTMSFDAAPAVPLGELAPGDRIRFQLERTGSSFRVVSAEKTGQHEDVAAGSAGIEAPAEQGPAPDFELIDQDNRRFALRDLRGSAVLLDFIFTRCAGPCPILTAQHAALQHGLQGKLRECTRFVSISVDPEHDRPHLLREYGKSRGADLREWWFLTGAPETVQPVLAAYGIAAQRVDPVNLVHVVATYLIDPQGRIAHRYTGLEHSAEQLRSDLADVCG